MVNNETTSVHKAIKILREFSNGGPELGVTEISKRLGMAKSTVSRLIQILIKEDIIRQNKKNRKYHLSLGVLEIGSVVYREMEICHVAPPFLRKLTDSVRSEIQLTVYDRGGIVCLIKLPETKKSQLQNSMGMRVPCHCNAAGKLLLAHQNEDEISRVLKEDLQPYTETTIVSPTILWEEITKIRELGYSISNGEYRKGFFSIAVPIVDDRGKLVAAISVTKLKKEYITSSKDFILNELKLYSRLISEKLGMEIYSRRMKV